MIMAYKLIDATAVRIGTTIMIEGDACIVKSIDISKTGKHGASKVRLEAVRIVDGKKRVMACPGHERFEVPMIEKRKAQVLSVGEKKVNVMDLESFETMDLLKPIEPEVAESLKEEIQVEYWVIENVKVIKRIL